jgi:hypothetical protein
MGHASRFFTSLQLELSARARDKKSIRLGGHDAGQGGNDAVHFDLRELVRGVAGEVAPQALRKDQTLEVDAPQLQRLGERFFRPPGSAEGGSGLGWSIVRRIAEVHGAQLQVQRSAALGGLEARLCFKPCA